MFRPMAYTVIFALVTSLVLSLTLMPVLASMFLRRSMSEEETLLVRAAKGAYKPALKWTMTQPVWTALFALVLFALSLGIATRLGAVFVPKLDEGAIAIQATRLPSVSLETSMPPSFSSSLRAKGPTTAICAHCSVTLAV